MINAFEIGFFSLVIPYGYYINEYDVDIRIHRILKIIGRLEKTRIIDNAFDFEFSKI